MKRNIITKAMTGSLCLSVLSGSAIIPGMTVTAASGASIISEVCASNTSNPASDGNFYDWIELYNPGSAALDLSGCGLSDSTEKPYAYTFKDGTVLQSGAKLVVYCDSKGTGDIAPFGLSTSGETITLTGKDGAVLDQLTFESLGENESYAEYPEKSGTFFVTSPTPGSTNAAPQGQNAIKAPEFSIESGFYENAIQLTISSPQNYTIYYTTDGSDPVPNSGTTKQFTGALQLTDRSGEPNVLSAHTDISYPDATAPGLVDKANVIRAIAVDASGTKSTTITKTYFVGKTGSTAYLKNMKVVSLVTDEKNLFDPTIGIYVRGDVFDAQGYTTGGGQFPGMGDWNQGGQQNPGGQQDPNQQNPGQQFPGMGDWNQGGQQDSNQQQDPNQQNGGWNMGDWNVAGQQVNIGADDDPAGQQNPGGWQIPGGGGDWQMPGGGFPGGGFGMLVDKDGKMVQNWEVQGNYTQKGKAWEREASMEVFDAGQPVLAQNVGIRIKGAASRNHAQKSFNVYARSAYGLDSFDYDFFSGTCRKQTNGKKIKSFDAITLRNGGNDNGGTWFRDSINQRLIADRNCAYQANDECMVFIDGEFWGIYQIMEKFSDDYLHDHFGIDKASAVMIKNGELEEGTDADLQDWEQLTSFCASNDMTNASNYKRFTDSVDVQSYIDYFAAQIYWNNWDWPQNNTAAWKTSTVDAENPFADGKWRMIIFDTEFGQGLQGQDNTSATYDTFRRIASNTDDESKMFISLLKNDEFKQQFGITFMDLANYNFASDKVQPTIDFFSNTYETQIADTKTRFSSGGGMSFGFGMGGATGFAAISQFYTNRATNVPRIVSSNLGIENTTSLVTVYNTAAQGTVKFNTLNLDLDQWSGNYFTAYPVTATAEPKEGVTFTGWEVTDASGSTKTYSDTTITVPVTGSVTIKANYSGTSVEPTKPPKQDPTQAPTAAPTAAPTNAPTAPGTAAPGNTVYGDANLDGKVNVSDAVTVLQFVANKTKYPMQEQGIINADIDGQAGITGSDAIVIQKVDAGVIKSSELPLK